MKASLLLLLTLLKIAVEPQRRLRLVLGLGVGEEVVSVALGLAAPFLLKRAIDRLTTGSALEIVALVGLFALSWIAPSLIAALKLTHSTRIVDGLFQAILADVARRQLPSLAGADSIDSAEVVGVIERLPYSLQLAIDGLVWRAAPLLAQAGLGLLALAVALPVRFSVMLGIALLLYLVAADLGAGGLSLRARLANQVGVGLSAAVADVFRNAGRVVANGAVEFELADLGSRADRRRDANLEVARRNMLITAAQFAALGFGLTALLIVAAWDARAGRLSVSDFVLLQAFALRLGLPLSSVAVTVRQAGLALANIGQALALASPSMPASTCGAAIPVREDDGSLGAVALTLERATFHYPGAAATLCDISFRLEPGEVIALVGANGSGKSTLARLMAGLLEPSSGAVLVDDLPVAGLAPQSRVRSVLYVPQFISLFNRSLAENGLYPPSHLSPEALADRLRAWTFFDKDRPIDLHEPVGERGTKLSGGQVQKLELARLCAIDAPILILDESTSALDGRSKALILHALRAQFRKGLLVIVTHSRAVAEAAERVVFLQEGRLAGLGPHATLMAHSSYRRLWRESEWDR